MRSIPYGGTGPAGNSPVGIYSVHDVRYGQLAKGFSDMTTMTTVEAREHFSDMLNRSAYGKERIVVTRRGRELAAILPVEDLRLLEELEDRIDVREALKALEEPGEISMNDLRRDLGI